MAVSIGIFLDLLEFPTWKESKVQLEVTEKCVANFLRNDNVLLVQRSTIRPAEACFTNSSVGVWAPENTIPFLTLAASSSSHSAMLTLYTRDPGPGIR